ncbi:glycosyl hydrolase [Mucilaginibacter sp. PAMC 26640]|nr:glycosyl hydrolase [Mucilaginibacter sp. PAMC 26640]
MKQIFFSFLLAFIVLFSSKGLAQSKSPKFKVIALYENGGHHVAYSKAARLWLDKLAADSSFSINYIQNTDHIDSAFLSRYHLFIQLDYPPYGWKEKAATAFKDYITNGRGGWIGFHHATLLGEFDGFPMWKWYSWFMGDIVWKNYIPDFASARVNVEDKLHPVMRGVPASFTIKKEEWYSYNKTPRPNVRVLASVDESTYSPNSKVKMGDHPVIWTNQKVKARNIYIFMGHSPILFDDDAYQTIVRNAIFWAAKKR